MSVNIVDPQSLNLIRVDGGGGGQYTFDDVPTNGSRNPVTSDGIYDAMIEQKSTIENDVANTYESKNHASDTYESKTHAANTYATDADLQEVISNTQSVTTAQAEADFEEVFGSTPNTPYGLNSIVSATSYSSNDVTYPPDGE